jgi:Zn-dependent peptidase ImmA (M78 family)
MIKRRRKSSGPRFLSDSQIARLASRLIEEFRLQAPSYSAPYDLHALIWDYLYEIDELCLDEDTNLGTDPQTGEKIWGKTLTDERMILIDPMVKTKPFYRFTLAHEIGHWVLHCRPLLRRKTMLNRIREKQGLEPSASSSHPSPVAEHRREIQANLFASSLLMPMSDVRHSFKIRFGDSPIKAGGRSPKKVKETAEDIAQQAVNEECPLREVFDVSTETMAVRLMALNLVIPASR